MPKFRRIRLWFAAVLTGALFASFTGPMTLVAAAERQQSSNQARRISGEQPAQGSGIGYAYYVLGVPALKATTTSGGAALMGGGSGSAIDDTFRWMCRRAENGNFVVIGTSGQDEDNPYVRRLCPGVRSVETLIVDSRSGAARPFVSETIGHADALFIQGGDQSTYINYWEGTPMQDAINSMIARGGVLGGKSAGLAVMGQFVFGALVDTITSPQALADPYDLHVTLVRDLLKVPHLGGVITDTHFVARDRLGRTVTFLARIMQDGWGKEGRAVAVDQGNSLLMDPEGAATLAGPGSAYFFRAAEPPQICRAHEPLTFRHIQVYRISAGGSFNLAAWKGHGGVSYELSAEAGTLHSTQAGGVLY